MFEQFEGQCYWNGMPILATESGLEVKESVPTAEVWNGRDWVEQEIVDTQAYIDELEADFEEFKNELQEKSQKELAQTNHNFRVLENRVKDLKKVIKDGLENASLQDLIDYEDLVEQLGRLNDELVEARKKRADNHNAIISLLGGAFRHKQQISELQEEVKKLRELKMDRPSVSQDLINAERYIDDINQLERKFNQERFRRRQKIQSKLKSIKKANEPKPTEKNDDVSNLGAGFIIAVFIVIAIFVGNGIGTLISGVL